MDEKHYWFPAKRYGWGWGLPMAWQGWAVLLVYFFAVVLSAIFIPPKIHPVFFALEMAALTAGLILIALRKGEPPKWRWGGK